MAWIYRRFGGTNLPLLNGQQDLGAAASRSGLQALPGAGAYDAFGSGPAPRAPRVITLRGTLVGTSSADLVTQLDALRALRGLRDKLYLVSDADAAERWTWARCLGVDTTRGVAQARWLDVSLQFELPYPVWYGTARLYNGIATANSVTTFSIANGGNTAVLNPVLSITAGASAITALTVETKKAGVTQADLAYSGAIAAGQTLVIDAGAQSIKNNGADAYAALSMTTDHVLNGWLRLDPGTTSLIIGITSSTNAPVSLVWNEAWE